LNKTGAPNWKNEIKRMDFIKHHDVIAYANEHHLENLIAIDNTASADFVTNYISLVENSFDLISTKKPIR
jgi:aspartokinase/homoserine dehydrogenase 1